MTADESEDVARRADAIYELRLKEKLERSHRDSFVAIEPNSGEYFLGRTLSEAIGSARQGASRPPGARTSCRAQGCRSFWGIDPMNGRVDASGRALVQIVVMPEDRVSPVAMEAWIDTGFTGELVLPHAVISTLGLLQSGTVEAELGDGSAKVLKTYSCSIEWFGLEQQIEVVANDGSVPLLGVGLLRERKLTVDYASKALTVE